MNKRSFLKAVAAGAAGSAFLPFIHSKTFAATGNGGGPMRLLCLATGYGGRWDNFRPRGLGEQFGREDWVYDSDRTALAIDASLTAQSLTYTNSSLQPLASYANKMTILEGLSFHNALIEGSLYSGHEQSPGNMFTGSLPRFSNDDVFASSASMDYVLGQAQGNGSAIRSAQLGIGCTAGTNLYDSIAFDNQGNRLNAMWEPTKTFNYLMGTSGSGNSNSTLAGKAAMLKTLKDSATRLRARLASGEAVKLDTHLDALNEIERQLNAQSAPLTCSAVTPPLSNPEADGPHMNKHSDVMFEIIAQAFACDRTRFISSGWGMQAGVFAPWLVPDVQDWHNEVAHNAGGGSETPSDLPLIAKANLDMAELHRYYATALKKFMDRLASVPEGDGTVLDNTLIIWAQDFGPWAHSGLNVPYVLLGGGADKFRMGRYISSYKNGVDRTSGDPAFYNPNNLLFNSVLQGFGVAENKFGGISGTLPGILKI